MSEPGMTAEALAAAISYSFCAHAASSTDASKAVRRWDAKTPYGIHPTWCAMTLLTETTLSEELRFAGAEALLYHDLLEDTTATLPSGTSRQVEELVRGMTFASSNEEMELIWERDINIQLLKVFDKTSNLLDSKPWMSDHTRERYSAYLLRLCDAVEEEFGTLNIIRIARAIAGGQ